MRKILDAKIFNGVLNVGMDEKFKEFIPHLLVSFLTSETDAETLKNIIQQEDFFNLLNSCSLSIEFEEKTEELKLKINGDKDSIIKLIISVLVLLYKKDNTGFKLNKKWALKFLEFKNNIMEKYKNEVIYNSLEENFVDDEGNLIIDFIVNNNIHTFKIPAGEWEKENEK